MATEVAERFLLLKMKKGTNSKHAGPQMKCLFTVRTFVIHFKERVCM
jgi:hypothetical protein